jgi:hypothetical protein
MTNGTKISLFDPAAEPQCWSDRMSVGEYAVHYSFESYDSGTGPTCTVFESLGDAESHARSEISLHPAMRCRIFTHEGLGLPPVCSLCGADYRDKDGLSAKFRRWTGGLLFFGGLSLLALDWTYDFRLSWPGTIGARALPVGLILLLTEFVIVWEARRRSGSR